MKPENVKQHFAGRFDELTPIIGELESAPLSTSRITALRGRFGNDIAARLVAVASLQAKARAKLGPGIWWVTERALQQATPWQVAQQKSGWFGDEPVFDLCCGIGGDAVWIARRGPTVAVEADRELIPMVQANLTAGLKSVGTAAVICADARRILFDADTALHIDPDRRTSTGRTTRPDQYEPRWSQIEDRVLTATAAVVKLAPAARPAPDTCRAVHRCWISLQGTVREQSLLCGKAIDRAGEQLTISTGKLISIHPGGRSALAIRGDGTVRCYATEEIADRIVGRADAPASFLIDPNESIRAAGLTESFAADHELCTLGGPAGFLTSDHFGSDTEMAVVGHVVWSGSCDERNLRRELRARDMFPETVKVRGAEIDPAKLTKRLRDCGSQAVTLWIGRGARRRFAALTVPVTTNADRQDIASS